jgi:uncharacterized protein
MIVKCPRCGKEAEMAGNPFRPFCSERCRTIDLGNWVSGAYRIPEDQPKEKTDDEPEPRKDLVE